MSATTVDGVLAVSLSGYPAGSPCPLLTGGGFFIANNYPIDINGRFIANKLDKIVKTNIIILRGALSLQRSKRVIPALAVMLAIRTRSLV